MLKEFKPILKNKNFLYLWTSQFFSQLAINIMNFVFLIRLFEKTESAIATSFLWVAYSLPAILIGPVASASVDILDRKRMLVITNLLQSLTIFLFAIFHGSRIFLIYEVVFVYSLLNQFYVPAESASLPSVVNKKHLAQANSLFFLTMQGSVVVGFGVAGLIKQLLGFETTLILCSSFLLIAFISTLLLPKLFEGSFIKTDIESAISIFFSKIIDGYKFIKKERKVLAPFLLMFFFQIALQVILVEVPVIAKNLFQLPLNSAGIFIFVPAATGAFIGALSLPKLIKKGWRKKKIIENSLIAISLLIFTISYIIPYLHYTAKIIFSFISIVLLGYSFVSVIIPSQTLIQESTPKDLLGRVFGNFWFLATIASVIPVVFSGTIVELFGVRLLLFTFSILFIGVYITSRYYGDKFLQG